MIGIIYVSWGESLSPMLHEANLVQFAPLAFIFVLKRSFIVVLERVVPSFWGTYFTFVLEAHVWSSPLRELVLFLKVPILSLPLRKLIHFPKALISPHRLWGAEALLTLRSWFPLSWAFAFEEQIPFSRHFHNWGAHSPRFFALES